MQNHIYLRHEPGFDEIGKKTPNVPACYGVTQNNQTKGNFWNFQMVKTSIFQKARLAMVTNLTLMASENLEFWGVGA